MTAPLQGVNLSCQPTTLEHNQQPTNTAPLHWCCDVKPHSGTALYMEWISTQTAIQGLPSIVSSHQPGKPTGQLHIMPYITFA